MNQLHDQLKILDNGDNDERQMINDPDMNLGMDSEQQEEDEDQHYPDEDEHEDMMQLEEMEAQMRQQQMMNLENQDFDDISPEILEAAQKMGLDDQGIRALQ